MLLYFLLQALDDFVRLAELVCELLQRLLELAALLATLACLLLVPLLRV